MTARSQLELLGRRAGMSEADSIAFASQLLDDHRAEVLAEAEQRPADAVHYGIRLPDGGVLDGTVTDLAEQQARLAQYRDLYPDAVLVQRDVHLGPWAEVTS